jgi:hypothetical protein
MTVVAGMLPVTLPACRKRAISAAAADYFFVSYNKLRNREFKLLRDAGPRGARELVEAGMKVFNNRKNKHGA